MFRARHIFLCALALALICPAPALARPGLRIKQRFEQRFEQAKTRFNHTRMGKKVFRVRKKARRLGRAIRGQITHTADGLELRMPRGPARLFHKARAYSPLSMGAFTYKKFKQDPVFLGSYKGFSWLFGKVGPPVLFKMGAGLSTSLLLPSLIGVPMDLGFIFGREHHLRKRANADQTLRLTARQLTGDYRDFVDHRRQQNRRYYEVYTKRLKERRRSKATP